MAYQYTPDEDSDREAWKKWILETYDGLVKSEEIDENTKDKDEPKGETNPSWPPGYKNAEPIVYDGDLFCSLKRAFKWFPRITGTPDITYEVMRPYVKRSKFSGQPYIGVKYAPRSCMIRKLINYPFRKMGGPQISIVGTYGTGKSNMMNYLVANYLARRHRVIMFNDRRFEARNLSHHGFFDGKLQFHPFIIDVWIPQGYTFKSSNPLWNHRKNVRKYEWETVDDILSQTKPQHLTVIYDEAFNEEGKVKLWIDIMQTIAERTTPSISYIFAHHELSSLIPEVPTKNIYMLTRRAANVALNLRKDRIGMITTFHMPSEVFYRVSQKFGYVCYKRPTNRQGMIQAEKDAKNYSIAQVNISKAGYWMKHTIAEYPELPDIFRLIPQRTQWSYPDLNPIEDEAKQAAVESILQDPINLDIMRYRAQGKSYREIENLVPLSLSTIYQRAKRLGLTETENP